MIQRIKTHNRLNGIKLCIAEFAIIAVIISPFAVIYSLYGQVLYALISIGMILNCLTVVAAGLRQLTDQEPDIGWVRLTNKQERDRIDRENPNLASDTSFITVTAMIPFVLWGWAAVDLLTHGWRTD
jgi:hypothetical protein